MSKQIKSATLSDAKFINQLIPQIKGVHVGGGIHVTIPDDWETKISNGEEVPGCSYAKIESDGSLSIDDLIHDKLSDSSKFSAGDKLKAAALVSKESDVEVKVFASIEGEQAVKGK